jgi:general secretion pathway protein I
MESGRGTIAGSTGVNGAVRPSGQQGFSLLEVMISLLIAGLALASVFHAASDSMRATSTAERYQEAVSRARSHLDALGTNIAAGVQGGDDGGGFRWRTEVRPIDSTGKRDAAGRPEANTEMLVVTLFAATVWISWSDGRQARSIRLDSARLLTLAPG